MRPPRPVTRRPPSLESEDSFLKPVPRAPYLDHTPSYKDSLSTGVRDSTATADSTLSSMKPIGNQKAQILLNDSMEDLWDSSGTQKPQDGYAGHMYRQPKVDFIEPEGRRKAPYGYPARPDVVAPRKKPPYAYPRSANALNKEEEAMARIQQRRMRYSDSSDT